jgi:hypothetical protein
VLTELREAATPHHYVGVFLVTLALGLAVGAVWEMSEYTSDRFLGTQLARSERETATDLIVDGGGAIAGAALLVAWAAYGWGSVRRIPGKADSEQVSA